MKPICRQIPHPEVWVQLGVDLKLELGTEFSPSGLVSLAIHEIAVRLILDGAVSRPFSGRTLDSVPSLPLEARPLASA